MGLILYSEDDYVADLGSSKSIALLTKAVRMLSGYPKLLALLQSGQSTDPVGIRAEIDILLTKEKVSPSVRAKLDSLGNGLRKVKEIAIISE